ncbi:MAG TPA: SRPBCC family protein [Hyphomonadaceae bacterium]|nr:SRPBCC family protein [Hyphomonadaceae bacterium]
MTIHTTALDVAAHLGAVSRVVEDRMHDGKPMRVVIASRAYDTSIEDLWDALTSQERLPRWFAPVDGDLKLGGRFQVKGNAGGTITACAPPRSFSATWEFMGAVSWINLALAPTRSGGAHLTLEHIMPPVGDHWDKFGPGAVGIGWELGLLGLGMHVRSKEARDTFNEHVWGASDEGKDFVSKSGEGWIAADIKGGEKAADATRRGKATISFYRGEPPPGTAHPGTTGG